MIKILLVDDQRMIREALKTLLEPEPDFKIVGSADNGISAINQVTELRPDIVLMNIEMPGMDGTGATQKIINNFPGTKVIILSSYDENKYVTKSLAVGAKGYLLKDAEFQDIVTTIRSVYKGYTQLAPGLLEKLLIHTDSGVIISKLKNKSYFVSDQDTTQQDTTVRKAKNTTLVAASPINRDLGKGSVQSDRSTIYTNNYSKIERDFPRVKRNLLSSSRQIRRIWMILLTAMPAIFLAIFLVLFNFYNKINTLENRAIPIERVGLYGELHTSGLAQRVTKAFEENGQLMNTSNVYVAQKGNVVFLKGTVDNPTLLNHIKNIAINVNGVRKVNTKALKIKSN